MERFERRLELTLRRLGRVILEMTLRSIEREQADQVVAKFSWQGQTFRRNRRTRKTIDTRFGTVTLRRWFYQNRQAGEPGVAPLDVRLGLVAGRITPAVAEVAGRLSADLPQLAVLDVLEERFSIRPGVGTLRRVITDLAQDVRTVHDEVAIEKLCELILAARKSKGKHDALLQVGRDGVFVQTRPCWEEASCGTLAVYDRSGKRLGTVYLGQMPESEQPTMSARLTAVITGVLSRIGDDAPTLRYVTDAGCHPQAYYQQVLSKMKHPLTGQPLNWSWGVDYFHACEYVSKLAAALLDNSQAASDWAAKQRKILKTKTNGVSRVIQSAAQQKRRSGLQGAKKDYSSALNYLKKYRRHMDFAARIAAGQPIGSGITEAGCKVIFNQRLKQSGMRWHRATGQHIVDLRTANRSGLWSRIWKRIIPPPDHLPPITQQYRSITRTKTHETALPR